MKKVLRAALCAFGAGLLFYTVVMAMITNFNFGLIATGLLGAVLLFYGIWFEPINRYTGCGFLKWLRYTAYVALVFVLALMLFLFFYGQVDTVTYQEDAIVILGAALRGETVTLPLAYRLDKGIDYAQKNQDAVIVVTGGQGDGESIPEAAAMREYLVQRGIPSSRILVEDKAESTNENFKYSKHMLDNYFGKSYTIAYVTNDFHLYRAGQLSRLAGYDTAGRLHAPMEWYLVPVTYLREVAAIGQLWLLKK